MTPVSVRELARILPNARVVGNPDDAVTGITHDSRRVGNGYLFVAVAGHRSDGRDHIESAIQAGAGAVLSEPPASPVDVTQILVPCSRSALAVASERICGSVGKPGPAIGITGTNGKTSVAYLVDAVLRAAGMKPLLVGSVETRFGEHSDDAAHTTPESPDLHHLWAHARTAGADALVMEASSHGLLLHRLDRVEFHVGVFTNLTRDHLDYHPDATAYRGAKTRLFGGLPARGHAVLSADDPAWPAFAAATRARVTTFGLDASAHVRAEAVRVTSDGIELTLCARRRSIPIASPLFGRFNVANLLAAGAVGIVLGLEDEVIGKGLQDLAAVPGRAQRIDCGQPFVVLNDFAHTPDALARILDAARELTTGRLHVVFGCGGDRDPGKRPEMGKAAAARADAITVTSDNPRTENPDEIIRQIVAPLDGAAHVTVQVDRTAAIRSALAEQKPGDTLVIAGKGHERYQIIGTTKHRFDDAEVIRRELLSLGYGT